MTVQNYAVYRVTASGDQPAGYVVNNILWDGISTYQPGEGLLLIADPGRAYPIGSVYAPAATSATKTG